jgi:RNA polymerase sigma-70 factor (ECF subfamily)
LRKQGNLDDYQNVEGGNQFPDDETLIAVANLPERYRAVIYLYYYEGYSSAEIAGILKKPRSTILNHLSEARKKLKGVLENE